MRFALFFFLGAACKHIFAEETPVAQGHRDKSKPKNHLLCKVFFEQAYIW